MHVDSKVSRAQTNLFAFLGTSLWFTPICVYDSNAGDLVGHGLQSAQCATGRPDGTMVEGACGFLPPPEICELPKQGHALMRSAQSSISPVLLVRWLKRRRTRSQPTRRTQARNQTPGRMLTTQRYAALSWLMLISV